MYVETSVNYSGDAIVYANFERTDNVQNSNTPIGENRFSISTNDSVEAIGKTGIHFLLENEWKAKNTIEKVTSYNATSSEWTSIIFGFRESNNGIKLIYHQIDTPHADICFGDVRITRSAF